MKPLLHLKTVLVIAHVALCTHLVIMAAQGDTPALAGSWAQAANH